MEHFRNHEEGGFFTRNFIAFATTTIRIAGIFGAGSRINAFPLKYMFVYPPYLPKIVQSEKRDHYHYYWMGCIADVPWLQVYSFLQTSRISERSYYRSNQRLLVIGALSGPAWISMDSTCVSHEP